MSFDVQKAASAINSSLKKLADQGFEEAKNPTAAGQVAFDSAAADSIAAVALIAKTVNYANQMREAVEREINGRRFFLEA
ncbi:MAG: hypothetical protein NT099_01450 [Candidatus Saganbacteria bacterium]|nr:hypothetical protein [Candidatus Saganbacteria bacterium]